MPERLRQTATRRNSLQLPGIGSVNFLALNLAHDIVTGAKDVGQARAKELLDYRRKKPTPYMDAVRFEPPEANTPAPDARVLSDWDLEDARRDGSSSRVGS